MTVVINTLLHVPANVGRGVLLILGVVGELTAFLGRAARNCLGAPFYSRQLLIQLRVIGFESLPVVGLTTIFAGMVLVLQTFAGFARFSAESIIPNAVVLSITRELAPVLAGLMLSGRVGAAIAAEIGSMRVTEQIDALITLETNPIRYLVVPRILAGLIATPCLVLVGDILGIFGGYLVGVYQLGFNGPLYLQNSWVFLTSSDVIAGLIKAAAFGTIVTTSGCYYGYHARGSATGVGAATTTAVVVGSIGILTANYIITNLLF